MICRFAVIALPDNDHHDVKLMYKSFHCEVKRILLQEL